MNSKCKVLSSFATSLLLAGQPMSAIPFQDEKSATQKQSSSDSEESWKTDPQVEQAANSVYEKLRNLSVGGAKPVNGILMELPDMKAPMAELALKRLIWKGVVWRIGEGTKESPYGYYGARANGPARG